MGFFDRFKNVVSAKANKALDKCEDPIELLELSINKKEELLQDAKKQCANFIASVDVVRKENNDLIERKNKYEEATKAALAKEDMQRAQSFVKQKLDIEQKISQTNARIKEQEVKIQSIKNKISDLEIEVSNMKSKKEELEARLDVADITSDINETLAGLNDDYGVNLDEIEKQVEKKESYSDALEQMKPVSEDDMLDEYLKDSPSTNDEINAELERLKNEMKK